jgi:hypothetical protein
MVSYISLFFLSLKVTGTDLKTPHLRRSPLKIYQCFRAAKLAACFTLVSAKLIDHEDGSNMLLQNDS